MRFIYTDKSAQLDFQTSKIMELFNFLDGLTFLIAEFTQK